MKIKKNQSKKINKNNKNLFSVLWTLLAYLIPKCGCADAYSHIAYLPLSAKLIILSLLIFFITLFALCLNACRSIMSNSTRSIFAYVILLGLTVTASIITNIYFITKSGGWTTYLIYDNGFYSAAGQTVSALFFARLIQYIPFNKAIYRGEPHVFKILYCNFENMLLKT